MVSFFFYRRGWRVRMKERWPRVTPVTRANHGIDNDRMEAHANLAGMGDFNCRAEIDLSLRGDLSCVRTIFHSFFLPHPVRPLPSCPLQSSKRECVFTLRKHLSLLRHVALKATEIEYEIQSVSEILRYAFMPLELFIFTRRNIATVFHWMDFKSYSKAEWIVFMLFAICQLS